MSGRTFAIGDIHGCDVAFEVLLEHLQLTAEDTLVVLGDYVDRGPGSRRVIELLLELQSRCRLICLMGNHEEMMLNALEDPAERRFWLIYGGLETVQSYGDDESHIPAEHIAFVRAGLAYWETGSEIFVHANLQPGVPLREQTADWLRWQHLTGWEPPHPTGKRIICGHTGMRSGLPGVNNGWVCIDTRACDGQFLTALEVGPDRIYQSQQTGTFRSGITLRDLA